MRSLRLPLVLVALVGVPLAGRAQDGPFKVAPGKDAPPAALAAPIKDALAPDGLTLTDASGKPHAKLWLRKAVPASAKPGAPNGAILFPFLGEGELLGVVEMTAEGHDARDQSVAPGVYTLRYGLQPVNGDHLGVSPNRDYLLLLPAAKDQSAAPLEKKPLEKTSAEAAGSNHPAIHFLVAAPKGKAEPSVIHDEMKNFWGVVLPLSVTVKGAAAPETFPVQMIFLGAAQP